VTVYTREIAFAAAYQHVNGSLCVYNAETGTWYANDDGTQLYRVRRVCEDGHPLSEVGESG
jgi:hypothetical protein